MIRIEYYHFISASSNFKPASFLAVVVGVEVGNTCLTLYRTRHVE